MSLKKQTIHWTLIFCVLCWHVPLKHVVAQEAAADQAVQYTEKDTAPIDVSLKNGVLNGSAFEAGGKPAIGKTVVLGKGGKVLSKTTVDAQGRFAFKGIKPGPYQLATQEAAAFVNCVALKPNQETKGVATQITLSRQAMIERGQQPASVLLHPLLIALVIAAAIAIPIAISNDKDDAS